MTIAGAPYRRLLAFAEAAPIRAILGVERCTVELDPALAQHTLEQMEQRSHGASLAELKVILDHAWRGGSGRARIVDHLASVAERYLTRSGPTYRLQTALTQDDPSHLDEPEAYAQWRWLSLSLPADILIASLAALHGEPPASHRVDLGGRHLQLLFEQGLTETHLHLGTAAEASSAWVDLATWLRSHSRSFASSVGNRRRRRGTGAVDNLGALFISGQILRLLLARHLFVEPLPLTTIIAPRASRDWPEVGRSLKATQDALAEVLGRPGAKHAVRALEFLLRFGPPPPIPGLQVALASLLSGWRLPNTSARGQRASVDPLSAVNTVDNGAASHEALLLFSALRAVRAASGLTLFNELVVQYLRIRTMHFSQLVQEPGTSGLDAFRAYYHRTRTFLRSESSRRVADAASICTPASGRLRSLEVRIKPPDNFYEYARFVGAVSSAALARLGTTASPPEIGVVLHIVRSESGRADRGSRRHASTARFQNWFLEQEIGIAALERALERWPLLLLMIRGIDVASAELGVPLWPTIDLLKRARRASERAAYRLGRDGIQVSPFKLTFHAGEEFPYPVHGLRRVHELIEFGILEPGDRVGHGLVLGTDLARWSDRGEPVVCKRDDLIDDLLWELERYARGDLTVDATRREVVAERARKELSVLFRGAPSLDASHVVELARAVRRLRHDPRELRLVGYPARVDRSFADGGTSALLADWLLDPRIRARGEEPVELAFAHKERAICEAFQQSICQKLARMGVTVETNPSSNLLIGGSRALSEHPSLRLFPIDPSSGRGERVLISINSDNPLLCATSLPDEFAYMFAALIRHGESAEEAHRWLQSVAENGYRSRFTVPHTTSPMWLEQLAALK